MGFVTNISAYTTYLLYEKLGTVKLKDLLEEVATFKHKDRICYHLKALPKGDSRGKYEARQILVGETIPETEKLEPTVYFGRSVNVTKLKVTKYVCHRDLVTGSTVHAWRPGFKKKVSFPLGERLDWELEPDPEPDLAEETARFFGIEGASQAEDLIGKEVEILLKSGEKLKVTITGQNSDFGPFDYWARDKDGNVFSLEVLGNCQVEDNTISYIFKEKEK